MLASVSGKEGEGLKKSQENFHFFSFDDLPKVIVKIFFLNIIWIPKQLISISLLWYRLPGYDFVLVFFCI